MKDDPKKPWKAVAAMITSGLGTLYQVLDNDVVTRQEGVGVALAMALTFGVVYGIPNPKV